MEGNKKYQKFLLARTKHKIVFVSPGKKQIWWRDTHLACTYTTRGGIWLFQGTDLRQTAGCWQGTGSSVCPGTHPASSAAGDAQTWNRKRKHFSTSLRNHQIQASWRTDSTAVPASLATPAMTVWPAENNGCWWSYAAKQITKICTISVSTFSFHACKENALDCWQRLWKTHTV